MVLITPFTDFTSITDEITIEHPLICTLEKIHHLDLNNRFFIGILSDSYKFPALGFFYGKIFDFFRNSRIQQRLPMQITILKGTSRKMGEKKYHFEIYFAILENVTYINSNLLGIHGYCEMDTYLKTYINVKGKINENLLEGILFHEYLARMFTSELLYQIGNKTQTLQKAILSSYQKAIYNNWELMVTLNQEPENLLNDFKINFLENESTFITQEMIKYKQKYGIFEFICEKMIYSKHMGLQGKIDRLVRNQKSTHFALYETKTGTSTRSSQIYAYYQCLAYATMLREFYPDTLDAMYIEYPRNPLTERLQLQTYNLVDLHKILEMRNEIWSILIGIQPITGPFKGCGQCFSKDACAFYCYRMFGTVNCENDIDKCKYYLYFEANAQRRALFTRMNAYFSWFSELLDREFLANLAVMSEIHLSVELREAKGNCIGNLIFNSIIPVKQISCSDCGSIREMGAKICPVCGYTFKEDYISLKETEGTQIVQLTFIRQNSTPIQQTRLRKGDYILITPQEFIPLTSESIPGVIRELSSLSVTVDLSFPIEKSHPLFDATLFRIDLTSSNYMIQREKEALDILIRGSVSSQYKPLERLRNLLLFVDNPKLGINKDNQFINNYFSSYDPSQQEAIRKALVVEDLLLIQGPPGTGKTTIIAEIIAQLVEKNMSKLVKKKSTTKSLIDKKIHSHDTPRIEFGKKPVLITAYTNKAVDTVVGKLLKRDSKLRIVRIGNVASISDPEVLARTLEKICNSEIQLESGTKQIVIDPLKVRLVLEAADVIATTTTSAANVLLENMTFDTVILDEAAQIIEPSALIALTKGDRVILVGDHMQLPPIMVGEVTQIVDPAKNFMEILHFSQELGLGLSIFERLCGQYVNSPVFCLLTMQYRMNKVINDFISQTFYQNALRPGLIDNKSIGNQTLNDFFTVHHLFGFNCDRNHPWGAHFHPEIPMVFLDTAQCKGWDSRQIENSKDLESVFNDFEADLIAGLVAYFIHQILSLKLTTLEMTNSTQSEDIFRITDQIGIISGYRAQNQQIRTRLFQLLHEKVVPMIPLKDNKKRERIIPLISQILDRIPIDTVDRFQGGEREIIFFSFVDSNLTNELGSLNKEIRRLNVAISRAKKKIILVGNSQTLTTKTDSDTITSLKAKKIYHQLIDYVRLNQGYSLLTGKLPESEI